MPRAYRPLMDHRPQPHAPSLTATRLMDACERVLIGAESLEQVTARSIAAAARTNASAINYHFGSQERLIVGVGERVYRRLNAERLAALQRAVATRAPVLPAIEDLIAALVGPPVRWCLDPASSYRVLKHLTDLAQSSREPDLYRGIVEGVDPHLAFVPWFRAVAPWLDDAGIGWRMNCALGIRSQALRHRHRSEMLSNGAIDFGDPEEVIRRMVEVIAPMFRRPS